MNKSIVYYYELLLIALLLILISACGGDSSKTDETVADQSTQSPNLTHFSFRYSNNPQLSSDIYVDINGNLLTARVNLDTPLDNLVATFEHEGEKIYVNGTAQVNSETSNDFSDTITYMIETDSGDQESYQVNLSVFTGLPIIYLNTDDGGQINSKDDYITGSVSVNPNTNSTGLSNVPMKIRGRGNSTWFTHPKKPYQMKLNDKAEFLGMPNDKKWLFLAEYSDKTLLRNTIAFEMGHISNLDWTPASTFAEVFINNQYNGTYNITQKVEESDNRVALGDTGYLLEIDQFDRLDADDTYFYSNDFLINIKEPDLEFDSSEYNYIKALIKEFESVLHGTQFKDPTLGYAQYIDIDSFIDWYLISEITKNVDSKFFSSIYLNVKPGEKIKMGPLWDFDLSFGNTDYADSQYYYGFWVKDHPWYARLFQDPEFVNKIRTRFAYFKDNQSYIIDKISQQAKYLDDAQQENNKKWQTIGIYVWPNAVVLDTYEQEVQHMKTWYLNRMNWLESAFNNL
ncbi:CotH kinase family protein [Colwelliaceae bacterium BS250]